MSRVPVRVLERIVAAALLVAGGAVLLGFALFFLLPGAGNRWTYVVAAVALAVQFIALGTSRTFGSLGRPAFASATVGWLIVAFADVVSGTAGIIGTVGEVLAVIGSLGAGIAVLRARVTTRGGDVAYCAAMTTTAVYLFDQVTAALPVFAAVVLSIVFGAGLIVAGGIILGATGVASTSGRSVRVVGEQ